MFTQTQQMLDILEKFAGRQGYTYHRMDGSTSIAMRARLMDDFNNNPDGGWGGCGADEVGNCGGSCPCGCGATRCGTTDSVITWLWPEHLQFRSTHEPARRALGSPLQPTASLPCSLSHAVLRWLQCSCSC